MHQASIWISLSGCRCILRFLLFLIQQPIVSSCTSCSAQPICGIKEAYPLRSAAAKAIAVIASFATKVATGAHFSEASLSSTLHIRTYVMSQSLSTGKSRCGTYRFIPGGCCECIAFESPGTIPNDSCMGFIGCDGNKTYIKIE